jgi:quinohemoprotein ethanol dehydrogenase
LMQASKNGFFYVIDRDAGKLISAAKFVKVTWADRIDLKTGRPVEAPNARYQSGQTRVWPGSAGAHSAQAMAYNPANRLAYIPALGLPGDYNDQGIDFDTWEPNRNFVPSVGIHLNYGSMPPNAGASSLLAWDPIRQRAVWRVPLPGLINGGIATTAGNLVFQGRCDGTFAAYAADSGKRLWSFDAQDGIIGAPITYKAAGRQYVSVLVGFAGPTAMLGAMSAQFRWDARTQQRRLLTFALDGQGQLPPAPPPYQLVPVDDPQFESNSEAETSGASSFADHCSFCHGGTAIAGGSAPDLRASALILSADAFRRVVQGGALLEQGMPRFEEVSSVEIESIRQYLRWRAHATHLGHP